MSFFQLKNKISIALKLSKVKITIAVAFTTITGYVLGKGYYDTGFIGVTIGIFLLACGSSVLNQLQEKSIDAIMDRTHNRPLPTGAINSKKALGLALFEIVIGSLIIFLTANFQLLILGWLALFWYNLVYTPLKSITPHAVIPGSVIGAIPPLIGWIAAGGSLSDFRAWVVAVFFFVWQVPHFYLLVLKYGTQYEKAGLPALTSRHNHKVIRYLIFIWILTTFLSAISLCYYRIVGSYISLVCLIIASFWLVVAFIKPVIYIKSEMQAILYFRRINFYILFVIIILNLDHFFIRLNFNY